MNWEAISAVAEILGATGVIISLIYLASQVRRNTHLQKITNLRDIATELATTARCTASNPELASLVVRGLADLTSLDSVERYRFDTYIYAFIANFERALIDARDGDYPEEQLIPMKVSIVEHLSTQGGRAWWEQRKTWFSLFGQQSIESTLGDLTLDSHRDGIDALVQKQTVASG